MKNIYILIIICLGHMSISAQDILMQDEVLLANVSGMFFDSGGAT